MEPKRLKRLKAGVIYVFADTVITRGLPKINHTEHYNNVHQILQGDILLATGRHQATDKLHWCEVFHFKSKKVLWMVTASRYHTSSFTPLT